MQNASTVKPRSKVSRFRGALGAVCRQVPRTGERVPLNSRLPWPGWSGWCSEDQLSPPSGVPGALCGYRSLPCPVRSLTTCRAVTAVPSPPPSKRQYAAVSRTSSSEARRAGRAGTGAKPAKRRSKSIDSEKRSTSEVSSTCCAARVLRSSAAISWIHGE